MRRTLTVLACAATALACAATVLACAAALPPPGLAYAEPLQPADRIAAYLETLARDDGGYGWADQPDGHLTPTFAVVGSYHMLARGVPDAGAVAEFVRTHHPVTGVDAETRPHASPLQNLVYQQIQALQWLGDDAHAFAVDVRRWTEPSPYTRRYELGANPVFDQEVMSFVCRDLLGMPLSDLGPEMTAYLLARRRSDGSFNNTPAADGSGGNVLNTRWGLAALAVLGRADSLRDETVDWLRATQLPGGGFTHAPRAEIAAVDDVAYTWAAVTALEMLGAEPADSDGAARYLVSLWNADGGFGDRPGLPSRPMATYYALDALRALGAFDALEGHTPSPMPRPALPEGLEVYTIQLQAQGSGSPAEAVMLARELGIHLWGAKNPDPGWVAAAQAEADARGVPVTFFVSNEEYGRYVGLPGHGTYSHLSDPAAPAAAEALLHRPGRPREVDTWEAFRAGRLAPLEAAGGRMVWQINDNEPFTRILMDHSLETGSGYAAISTFHMKQNFAYFLPWLFRYRHEIPFVALQDAHGEEAWWWAEDLTGYRTLFLAEAPTWDAWLEALANNRVVAVRHDAVTNYRMRMLGGAPGVQAFVKERMTEWKWWGERPEDIRRPWASLVAVTPADTLEAGRPAEGVALRVRLWWDGLHRLNEQVVELVELSVDGERVEPALVEDRTERGALVDHYYRYDMPASAPGAHVATATVRRIDTGEVATETLRFSMPESAVPRGSDH